MLQLVTLVLPYPALLGDARVRHIGGGCPGAALFGCSCCHPPIKCNTFDEGYCSDWGFLLKRDGWLQNVRAVGTTNVYISSRCWNLKLRFGASLQSLAMQFVVKHLALAAWCRKGGLKDNENNLLSTPDLAATTCSQHPLDCPNLKQPLVLPLLAQETVPV